MYGDESTGTASDTLESLKTEREDLEKTVACVRRMARDFDTLAERRKSFDAKRVAFHLQLKGPHLRRCVWKGIITPEAFQWHKAAIARKKALRDQMLKDAAAFCQALVRWAEDLEKREQQQNSALSAVPSAPIVTGANGLMPDRSGAPVNKIGPDEGCSQDNSGGNPGVLIYTNNWDTYVRYTTTQSKYGQLAKAYVTYVGADSSDNIFLATDNPLNVWPSFNDATYRYRVTINQGESWYYLATDDARAKADERAFISISGHTPSMVGFSPIAGAGEDAADIADTLVDIPEAAPAADKEAPSDSPESLAPPVKSPEAAPLEPYCGPGGGHHVPAKKAFEGNPVYNPRTAPAIPNSVMKSLKVNHDIVSGAQQTLYRAYSQSKQPLTWNAIQMIETQALAKGGMDREMAAATVSRAINILKTAGIIRPTRIPWGEK